MLNLKILKLKFNLEIKNIAHVGVDSGKEVELYRKLFGNSDIHLFEPNNSSFKELHNKYSNSKNIHLYNVALGNSNEEKILNTSSDFPNTSSILEPHLHKVYYPEIIFDDKEVVSLRKFDSLNINNINFMSIDTQGYELEVLKGSEKNLVFMDYLIVEINRKHLYKNSPLEKDIDIYLKQYGFIRAVTSYWGKECVWGDAFYIKKSKISKPLIFKTVIKNFLNKSILIYKTVRFLKMTLKNSKLKKL
tara:strand:- start:150 stop:890 length:741 start_codon:yes stop_codon:yes gene_type:complete